MRFSDDSKKYAYFKRRSDSIDNIGEDINNVGAVEVSVNNNFVNFPHFCSNCLESTEDLIEIKKLTVHPPSYTQTRADVPECEICHDLRKFRWKDLFLKIFVGTMLVFFGVSLYNYYISRDLYSIILGVILLVLMVFFSRRINVSVSKPVSILYAVKEVTLYKFYNPGFAKKFLSSNPEARVMKKPMVD